MRNVSHILEKQLTDYLVTDQARFYRLAYSYLKNREEALDAVQTAVCRALEKQGELKEPEALRAWFYHILVHVCMDVLRSRKRVTLIPPEALDAGSYVREGVKTPFLERELLEEYAQQIGLE